jgi:hypothetical protein
MSLNRYEQAVFDYWERSPDERRHWHTKVVDLTRQGATPMLARGLERELWSYLLERSENVPQLRNLGISAGSRVSMLNLAEYVIRLWGPPPKPRRVSPSI